MSQSQERSQPASAQSATAQPATASAQPTVGASTASGGTGGAPGPSPAVSNAQKPTGGGGAAGSWEFDDGLKNAMGLGGGGAAGNTGGKPHAGLGGGTAKPAKPEAAGGEHKEGGHGDAHGSEAAHGGSPAHGKGGQDPGAGHGGGGAAGKGGADIKGDLRKALQGKTPDIDAMLAGIDRATPQQCQTVLDDKALMEELRAILGSDKMERVANRLRARAKVA